MTNNEPTHETNRRASGLTGRRRMATALLGAGIGAGATLLARSGAVPPAHASDGLNNFTSADPEATIHAENTATGNALLGTNDSNGTASGNGVVGARGGSGAGDGVRALRTGDGAGHAIQAGNNTTAKDSHGLRVKRAVYANGSGHGVAAGRVGPGEGDAVHGDRTGDGPGNGVVGQRFGGGAGHGVAAGAATTADDSHGIRAERNYSGSGDGAHGRREGTGTGNGVYGLRTADGPGAGVRGEAAGASNTGVHAVALDRVANALRVEGRSRFSTVGSGSFSANTSVAAVTNPLVTADSHITVMLTSDPNGGAVVQWVQRVPASGFRVHLSGSVPAATGFTYFIVEPV